jgi:hypothetical protein
MPASTASAAHVIIRHLGARCIVEPPVALVVAHPDDETIGLGPLLKLLRCAITHLEGNEATFFAVFACFLHIAHKI